MGGDMFFDGRKRNFTRLIHPPGHVLMGGEEISHGCGTQVGSKTMGLTPSPHHLWEPEIVGPWPETMDWMSGLRGNKYNCCLGRVNN